MRRFQQATKEAGIFVVLGYSERSSDSLYISQAYIDPSGINVHHRRKIKPTHVEQSIWSEGEAESLDCVVRTPLFGSIGALNCWEHLQPLLRYYEYSQGVGIPVGSWLLMWPRPEDRKWPHFMTAQGNAMATQFSAMRGTCFPMASMPIIRDVAANNLGDFPLIGTARTGGFAMIFGADGS